MDCSPPGSSIRGIFQARVLEWVAGSSWPRDWTRVSCIAGRFSTIWATREVREYFVLRPVSSQEGLGWEWAKIKGFGGRREFNQSLVNKCQPKKTSQPKQWELCFVQTLLRTRAHDGTSQVAKWPAFSLPIQEKKETWVQFLGREDPLEEEMTTHSSILPWKIQRTEEPGGLQFMGVSKIRTQLSMHA